MPILDANAIELFSNSPQQTRRLGMQLGALLESGDLLCLQGELGAGKTTLVQGIAAGWGSPDAVTSPSYVLVNIYGRGGEQRLAHLDAYRLEGAAEAEALDLDALLEKGPMVVEWAEKIESVLPDDRLWLKIYWVDEDRRRIEIIPEGEHYEDRLDGFRETVFGVA